MFIPGETITHEFIIPFLETEISKVIVTYKQNNRIILTKPISSGFEKYSAGKTKVILAMSQKESLLFDGENDYTIQLNVLTVKGGSRATCAEFQGSTAIQHYKEVINNG